MSEWFATLAPFKTKVREQKWVFNGFFVLDSFNLKTGKYRIKKGRTNCLILRSAQDSFEILKMQEFALKTCRNELTLLSRGRL